MILDSLVLENIRSYGHEEIVFPKGITLFKGDIGSGKSSILMGIEFALFGFGQGGLRAILAKKAHMGHATLEFTVNDKKYEIRRTILSKNGEVNQDSKNSYIKVNGEKEPLSAMDLKRRVLEILRFNESASIRAVSRIYRYAVFTPQEEMKSVLNDTDKRKEMIRKAFGVEDYSNAGANSEDLAKRIGVQADIFRDRSRGIEEMEKQNQASKEQIIKTSSEIATIKEKIKTIEDILIESEKKMTQLQEKNMEKDRLQNKREQLEKNIGNYQDRIASLKAEIANAKKTTDETRAKLDRIKNIKKPTEKTRAEIQAEIEGIAEVEKRLVGEEARHMECMERIKGMGEMAGKNGAEADKKAETLQESVNQMKEKYNLNEKKLDELKRQETENVTNSAVLRKEIAKFTDLGTKCPTCERDITTEEMNVMKGDRNTHLDRLNQELKEIKGSIDETKEYSLELDGNIQEVEAEIDKCKQMASRIAEYEEESKKQKQMIIEIAEIKTLHENLKRLSGYADDPIGNLVKLKEGLAEYETETALIGELENNMKNHAETTSKRQAEAEKLEADSAEDKKEIQEIDVKMKFFDGIDSEMESVTHQRRDADQETRDNNQRLGSLEQSHQNENQRIKENDEKITSAKGWKMQHAKFSEYQKWLETYFGPAIANIEKEVMLSILQNFDETYRKWYLMLIDDPTKESSIDEDFAPSVTQDGFEQDVASLSGGEKTSIALAYRLTLNSLMQKEAQTLESNLLILDEPTDGFSRDQMVKVKDVLDELNSEQIILVSHDEELAAHAEHVFHVTKENGKSRITAM